MTKPFSSFHTFTSSRLSGAKVLSLMASVGMASLIGLQDAKAGGYREFKDSRTWCSVALTCSVSTSAKAYEGVTTLSIRRHNPLSAPVELVLETRENFTAGDQIDFSIDGKSLLHIKIRANDPAIGTSQYVVNQPAIVEQVIEQMKKGSRALITLRKQGSKTDSQFSLAGSVASMLYLDEFQDLLDTPYAFHAKGAKKPNPRADIEAITRLDQVPGSLLQTWFSGEDKQCSFFDDGKMERLTFGDGFKMRIGAKGRPDGGMLYSLPCGTGGAYNQPYGLFFEANDQSKPVVEIPFKVKGKSRSDEEMADAWNIGWDFKNKSLESFFKGRGLGDCGSFSRWVLKHQGGEYFFDLGEMRVKDDCDGNYAGGPTKWPLVK